MARGRDGSLTSFRRSPRRLGFIGSRSLEPSVEHQSRASKGFRARTPPSKKGGHLRGEQVAQGFDGLEI